MRRALLAALEEWLGSTERKPMVIRGARQVGKTWLVRRLAAKCQRVLFELNFERRPELKSLFDSNDPRQILLTIEAYLNQSIDLRNSILFLDEIQAAPELLSKLRWFAEEVPELPVVAAGSLLEFVLAEHTFSMPVGRIGYLHLEPLSFEEFLLGCEQQKLFDYVASFQWGDTIPEVLHQQLSGLFREYIIVGGMPAAVSSWAEAKSLERVNQIHHDLLATYRDDFAKYSGRISVDRLEDVLMAVPKLLGKKFVFSHVNKDIQAANLKQALDLLTKARLCHKVSGCSANGLPLAAEIKEKFFKVVLLDVGIVCAALGLRLHQIQSVQDITLVNSGGISEQVVGQLLRTIEPFYVEPALYYWQREQKHSSAEMDYLLQDQARVVPLEVKAGSTGSLKSLHLFMALKKLAVAVRINSDLPSRTNVNVKTHVGEPVRYELLSLPFYLVGQIHRLLGQSSA